MSSFVYIEEIEKSSRFDHVEEIEKFNPYHDSKGRFSTAGGAASFTYKPGQGAMYDRAIEREKQRMASASGNAKKGLVAGFGEEHAQAIEKIVQENAPDEVKAMWDRYGDGIRVADASYGKTAYCSKKDGIHMDIEKDAYGHFAQNGLKAKESYQDAIHESGHAIDDIVSEKVGYEFSVKHNGGKFEKLLVQESNDYIKSFQKQLQQQRGGKVSIADARKELGMSLFAEKDYLSTGMLSDILEGATKGKFSGTCGHGQQYWTGWKDYFGQVHGQHSVATEAFAHFTSMAANGKSASRLQSVFPESYKEYLSMCQYAASL